MRLRWFAAHRHSDLLALAGLGLFVLALLHKILFTNQILVGLDLFTYFYPYRDYVAQALRAGHLPLWNPYLFCGVPLLANPQSAVLYPLHWPLLWLEPPRLIAWSIALHLWLAGSFAYAYGRRSLHLSPLAACGGALVLVGSGFLGIQAEQINQLNTTTWLPLSLLLLDEAGRRSGKQRVWATVFLGVTIALQFLAGHTQTFYINMIALGLNAGWPMLRWAARWARTRRPPPTGPQVHKLLTYALGVSLGLGLAGAQFLPTLELSRLSVRGRGLSYREAASFSLRPHLLLLSLLPTFGNEDLSGEHIAYVGILPLGLALIGLVTTCCPSAPGNRELLRGEGSHSELRGFPVCLAFSGLTLALGGYNPLYPVLYHVMPGVALFRAPGRWLALYTLGGAMMAGIGLERLVQGESPLLEHIHLPLLRMGAACATALAIAIIMSTSSLSLLSPPTARTLVAWAILMPTSSALLYLGLHRRVKSPAYRRERRSGQVTYAMLLLLATAGELTAASQKLSYNHPTAPQAYSFLQPTLAYLRTDPGLYRFISIIHPNFDPGNLSDIQTIFSSQLSPRALYDYIISAKLKAILERNLPLRYRMHSIDGYDGGVLPLRSFLGLQRMFLPQQNLTGFSDGRLRERLQHIPDGQLLSLLNVKYVITDKVLDLWSQGVYYDLSHEAVLRQAETVELRAPSEFPAMELGVISFLEGTAEVAQGTPAAEIVVRGTDLTGKEARTERFLLLTGIHTAEGKYNSGEIAHMQATVANRWDDEEGGVNYIARFKWGTPLVPRQLTIRGLLPVGQLHVRALTLIDPRMGTFEPLIVSTSDHYRSVYSGALKIYENLDVLPRAFFIPYLNDGPPSLIRIWKKGRGWDESPVHILSYSPEQVVIEVRSEQPGYLVLTDTFYPGWQATIDGTAVPILRAKPCFRALRLEAGQHRVEFAYRPTSLRVGVVLSSLSLLIALLSLARSSRQ